MLSKFALGTAVLISLPTAFSATLEITATTEEVQHFFNPGGGYENLLGRYYGGAAVPAVTGRFADYDRLRVTLSAPEGFMYQVTPSPETYHVAMHVGLFYNYSYSGGRFDVLPTTVEFVDYIGPGYTSTIESRAFYGGTQFYSEGWISWSTTASATAFQFSRLVIESDLSLLTDMSTQLITYIPSFGSAIGVLTYTPLSMTTDPGPMVRLVPVTNVPEPPSLLLSALGISLLAAISRNARNRCQRIGGARRSGAA